MQQQYECLQLLLPITDSRAAGSLFRRGTVVDNERLQNFSVDTQLQSNFSTGNVDHILLTGVDYMRMRNDISALFGNAPSLDLNNLPSMSSVDFGDAVPYQMNESKQTGIYLQDQAEWNKWVLTLGGRYDWSKQATTVRSDNGYIERNDRNLRRGESTICLITEYRRTLVTASPSNRMLLACIVLHVLPMSLLKVSSTKRGEICAERYARCCYWCRLPAN